MATKKARKFSFPGTDAFAILGVIVGVVLAFFPVRIEAQRILDERVSARVESLAGDMAIASNICHFTINRASRGPLPILPTVAWDAASTDPDFLSYMFRNETNRLNSGQHAGTVSTLTAMTLYITEVRLANAEIELVNQGTVAQLATVQEECQRFIDEEIDQHPGPDDAGASLERCSEPLPRDGDSLGCPRRIMHSLEDYVKDPADSDAHLMSLLEIVSAEVALVVVGVFIVLRVT